MSGEVANYRNCNMGFGQYCRIHEEDQPRNSMKARTQGAISLGPGGNVQGGHKLFTLTNGTVVTRSRAWTELPTPKSVIESIHVLAQGMPAMPVFKDRRGLVNGDAINYELYNNDDDTNQPPVNDADPPGVHKDEMGGDFEILGVEGYICT
jgi:hypothetical protein